MRPTSSFRLWRIGCPARDMAHIVARASERLPLLNDRCCPRLPLARQTAAYKGLKMLVLRSSPTSPFGRKVKISAALLGLSDRITIEKADTSDPNDSLRRQNPLGKIPILL